MDSLTGGRNDKGKGLEMAIAKAESRKSPDDSEFSADNPMSEAEIDRNLVDSFPASDPPSWTLGIAHETPDSPPDELRNKSVEDRRKTNPTRRDLK